MWKKNILEYCSPCCKEQKTMLNLKQDIEDAVRESDVQEISVETEGCDSGSLLQ